MKLKNFKKNLIIRKLEDKDEFIKNFINEPREMYVTYLKTYFTVDFNRILPTSFMQNVRLIDKKIEKTRNVIRPDIIEREEGAFFDHFFSFSKYRFEDVLKYDTSKLLFSFDKNAQQRKLFEKIKFYFDFLKQNRSHIKKEKSLLDYFAIKFLDNEEESDSLLPIDLYYSSSVLSVKIFGLASSPDNPARLRNAFDSEEIAREAIELTAKAHKIIKEFLFELSKELIIKSIDTEEKMRDSDYTFLELNLFKKIGENQEEQLLKFKISENKVSAKMFELEADKKDVQKLSEQIHKVVKYILDSEKNTLNNFEELNFLIRVLFQNFLCKYDKENLESEADRVLNYLLSF